MKHTWTYEEIVCDYENNFQFILPTNFDFFFLLELV